MRVGFVGLGSMGSAIALNLLENGVEVVCWNRSSRAAAPLADAGATIVGDVREVLRMNIVLSMLSNDQAVREVFTTSALESGMDGRIHVAMETLSPREAKFSADRHRSVGVSYVAAPVIGRPPVARAGQLHIICAGDLAVVDTIRPLLDIVGKRTWHFGDDVGLANLVKACVNFNIIHSLQSLGESMALLDSRQVDPLMFVQLLNASLYPGPVYEGYGRMIATRQYAPAGFSVGLGLKDLTVAEQIAAAAGVTLPSAAILRRSFEKTLTDPELSELDWSAIAETLRNPTAGD